MYTDEIRVVHLDDDPELLTLSAQILPREYDDLTVKTVSVPEEGFR